MNHFGDTIQLFNYSNEGNSQHPCMLTTLFLAIV